MPVYLISQLKIFDRKRFRQMQMSFMAIKPADAVILAGDSAPKLTAGETCPDHVGILAFCDHAAAEAFLGSPEYQTYAVMREACAEVQTLLIDGTSIDLELLAQQKC